MKKMIIQVVIEVHKDGEENLDEIESRLDIAIKKAFENRETDVIFQEVVVE